VTILAIDIDDIIKEFAPENKGKEKIDITDFIHDLVAEVENTPNIITAQEESNKALLKVINTGKIEIDKSLTANFGKATKPENLEKPVRADSIFEDTAVEDTPSSKVPLFVSPLSNTGKSQSFRNKFPGVQPDNVEVTEEVSNSGKIKISIAKKIRNTTAKIKRPVRPADADNIPVIKNSLKEQLKLTTTKVTHTFFVSLISCYVSFAAVIDLPILKVLEKSSPFNFSFVQLVLGLYVLVFAFDIVADGIKSFFTLRANYNTLPVFSLIACLIATGFSTLFPDYLKHMEIYMSVALLAMLFALIARYKILKHAEASIDILMSDNRKYTLDIVKDEDVAVKLSKAGDIIAVKNEAKYLKDVEKSLVKTNIAGKFYAMYATVFLLVSIAAAFVCYFIDTGNISQKQSLAQIFTDISLLLLSVTSVATPLILYLPMDKAAKVLNSHGGIFNHFGLVEKLSETNTLLLDIKDIIPYTSIDVGKMTLTDAVRKDEIISYLASLLIWSDSLLSNHFLQVLKDNENIFDGDWKKAVYRIDDFEYAGEGGYKGSIKGKSLYFGNREYMTLNDIHNIPTVVDIEANVDKNDTIFYFAIGNRVVAYFGVEYDVESMTEIYVQRICKQHKKGKITLHIHSNDCNISANLLSRLFNLDENCFSILPVKRFDDYEKQTAVKDVASAYMVTDGRFVSTAETIIQSRKIGDNINVGAIIQTFLSFLFLILCSTCILFTQSINPLMLLLFNVLQTLLMFLAVNGRSK
jgi:cation transport ATPase